MQKKTLTRFPCSPDPFKKKETRPKGFSFTLWLYIFITPHIFIKSCKNGFFALLGIVYASLIGWVKKILDDSSSSSSSSSSLEDLNLKIGLGFWIWKDFFLKWMNRKHAMPYIVGWQWWWWWWVGEKRSWIFIVCKGGLEFERLLLFNRTKSEV